MARRETTIPGMTRATWIAVFWVLATASQVQAGATGNSGPLPTRVSQEIAMETAERCRLEQVATIAGSRR